jgi:hypothetical protein
VEISQFSIIIGVLFVILRHYFNCLYLLETLNQVQLRLFNPEVLLAYSDIKPVNYCLRRGSLCEVPDVKEIVNLNTNNDGGVGPMNDFGFIKKINNVC